MKINFLKKIYFQCMFYHTEVHVVTNLVSRPNKHQTLEILCLADFLCSYQMFKITVFLSGSFPQVLRVTEEDSISETTVWPILIIVNMVTALKGTHFYFLFKISHFPRFFKIVSSECKNHCLQFL